MPETPVLVIWDAAQQDPDDVFLHGTVIPPEQSTKTWTKASWFFCTLNITSVAVKPDIDKEPVSICVSQSNASGAACERSWPWTRGGTESKRRDALQHTAAVVLTASPQTLGSKENVCVADCVSDDAGAKELTCTHL